MSIIHLLLLNKTENDKSLLKNINLKIEKGEFVACVGKSGAGKTTLINVLSGIVPFSSGTHNLNGKTYNPDSVMGTLPPEEAGLLLQDGNLIPELTAKENINLPFLYINETKNCFSAKKISEFLGILPKWNKKTGILSGGEQQRAALAKIIACNPKILFLDEPTANLDEKNKHKVLALLSELNKNGTTIFVVTHDKEIAEYASRIITLENGEITSDTPNNNLPQSNEYSAEIEKNAVFGNCTLQPENFLKRIYSIIKEKRKILPLLLLLAIGCFFTLFVAKQNGNDIEYLKNQMAYYSGNVSLIKNKAGLPENILDKVPAQDIEKMLVLKEGIANVLIKGKESQYPVFYGDSFFLNENLVPSDFSFISRKSKSGVFLTRDLAQRLIFSIKEIKDRKLEELKININGKDFPIKGIISDISKNEFSDYPDYIFYAGDLSLKNAKTTQIYLKYRKNANADNLRNIIIEGQKTDSKGNLNFTHESGDKELSITLRVLKANIKLYFLFVGIAIFLTSLILAAYGILEKDSFAAKAAIRKINGADYQTLIKDNSLAFAIIAAAAMLLGAVAYYCLNFSRIALMFMPSGYDFKFYVWSMAAIVLAVSALLTGYFAAKYASKQNIDILFRENRLQ